MGEYLLLNKMISRAARKDSVGHMMPADRRLNTADLTYPSFQHKVTEKQWCDFEVNCPHGEDEVNCTDGRRYCQSGVPPFVKHRMVTHSCFQRISSLL